MNTFKPPENRSFENSINILIVDDLPDNLHLLSNILKNAGYTVRPALSGKAALNAIRHTPADLILLDMRMPEMDGIAVCRELKQDEKTRDIPVIFISAIDDAENKITGFQAGGVDYITKPFQPDEVLARIRIQIELRRTQKKLELAYHSLEKKVSDRAAELMAANDALRESESKYRTLNENLPLGIFRTIVSGRILSANQALANILGFDTPEQTMANPITNFFSNPEDRQRFFKLIKETRDMTGCEISMKRRDGTAFEASISARIVLDYRTGMEYIDGLVEDISEKKRIEERNRLLEKQILQAQKMEAIGTLAGGIAHDFNNILSAVLGFTELARLKHSQGKDISEYLNKVFSAGIRARDLVNQILTFSRHDDIERSPIVIIPLIKETLKFLTSTLPSTIDIRHQIINTHKTVMADPTQIQQILMNLCTNAAHAMNEKGALDIQVTEKVCDDKSSAYYKTLPQGEYLYISVSDTGHGIDPGIIHRIFEPFFTTKKIGEGTGMGLSMVHGIVKNMGGEITVYSEVGKGTTFNVLLPVYKGAEEQTVPEKPEAVEKGSGNILLVDDEEGILQPTMLILTSLGYDVVAKTSSREALEHFKSETNRIDLVLTDLTMPGMTGLELAAEIHKISPEMPVLLCTGFSTGITEQIRIQNGINAILIKPVLKHELARAVKDALDTVRQNVNRTVT